MLHVSSTVLAASLLFQVQSAAEPSADGVVRRVVFSNNTQVPVAEIYISDDNASDWRHDLLESEFLLPNSSWPVNVVDQNGNCKVDLKVVFDNGSTSVSRDLNVCVPEKKPIPIR